MHLCYSLQPMPPTPRGQTVGPLPLGQGRGTDDCSKESHHVSFIVHTMVKGYP